MSKITRKQNIHKIFRHVPGPAEVQQLINTIQDNTQIYEECLSEGHDLAGEMEEMRSAIDAIKLAITPLKWARLWRINGAHDDNTIVPFIMAAEKLVREFEDEEEDREGICC